jgi:hypothetical protein
VGERAAVGHGLDEPAEVLPPVLLGGGPQLGGRGVRGGGVLEGDQQATRPHRHLGHGADVGLDDVGGLGQGQGGGERGPFGERHIVVVATQGAVDAGEQEGGLAALGVDGLDRRPGLAGDRLHRRAEVALADEERGGCVKHGGAGRLRLGPAQR